jgi:hypothetical protein
MARAHVARMAGLRATRCVPQWQAAAARRMSSNAGATATEAEYNALLESWTRHTRSLYTFYQTPLLVTKAQGAELTDHRGKVYLDFYNNVHQVRARASNGSERVLQPTAQTGNRGRGRWAACRSGTRTRA